MTAFQTLQISADSEERDIKRAYAKLIKQFRPETHPVDFARIREAYEAALIDAKWRQQWQFEEAYEADDAHTFITQNESPENAAIAESIIEPAAPEINDLKADSEPLAQEESAPFHLQMTLNAEDFAAFIAEPTVYVESQSNELQASAEEVAFAEITPQPAKQNIADDYFTKLNFYAETSDEKSAETLTEHLIDALANTTLDEKSALEDNLLSWYLNAEAPLLLAFIWLNNTFGWTNNSVSMSQNYGDWHANRIARIHELAIIYENALNAGDIDFAQTHNVTQKSARKKWLLTTDELLQESPSRMRWQDLCAFNGYEKLSHYFKKVELNHWQFVWADAIFGALFAGFAWLLSIEFSLIKALIVTLICFAVMSCSRLAGQYIMRKIRPIYAKSKDWLLNKFPLLAWVDSGTKLAVILIAYGAICFAGYTITEIEFFLQVILVPIFAITIGFVALVYLGLLVYAYKFSVGIERLIFGFGNRLKSAPAFLKSVFHWFKSLNWIVSLVLAGTFVLMMYMQHLLDKSQADIKPASALELRNQALEEGKPPP